MSVIVPSYAFTYVKIGFLKQLLIPESELTELEKRNDIRELIDIISPYYPDLDIKKYTIDEMEKQLYHIYIKLIGRIISYSPENMRRFLQDFLTKYEIMNVKQIILGIILGMSLKEKKGNVNFRVQNYLDRREFIEGMVRIASLDELQLFLRNTEYYRPVREGLLSFRNRNEIFVLESFLDQLYYKRLTRKRTNLNKYEKKMFSLFTRYITEGYNLKMIYRGIINNIERKILAQFLVDEYLFLDKGKIEELLSQTELEMFFKLYNMYLKDVEEMDFKPPIFSTQMEHPIWKIEQMYQKFFFKSFELKADNIDFITIYRIFELVIKKEREIKSHVLPNIIRIIHKKFNRIQIK